MTIDPDTSERPGSELRLFGLDPDDAEVAERANTALASFMTRMRTRLIARRVELVDLIDPEIWRYLLQQQARETRRGMLHHLGFPPAGRKYGKRLLDDLTARLRRGVKSGEGVAFDAAHDLTHPIRAALDGHALGWLPLPDPDLVDAPTRACAVALRPDARSFLLPAVLHWMRTHDPEGFHLLLPEAEDVAALMAFFDEIGVDPQTRAGFPSARRDHLGDGDSEREELTEVDDGSTTESGAEAVVDRPSEHRQAAVDAQSLTEAARRTLDAAMVACRATLDRLEQGRPPTEEAVAQLTAARAGLVDAAATLSEQTSESVEPSLAAIEAAARRLNRSATDAETLQQLLGAQAPAIATHALTEAAALARKLLDAWPPTSDQDRSDSAMLVAIVDLVRAATTEPIDDADVEARYERLRASAPAAMSPLLLAAARSRVQLATDLDVVDSIAQPSKIGMPDSASATMRHDPNQPDVAVESAQPDADGDVAPDPGGREPDPLPDDDGPHGTTTDTAGQGTGVRTSPVTPPQPAHPAPVTKSASDAVSQLSPTALTTDGSVEAKAAAWLTGGHFALASRLLAPTYPGLSMAARLTALADAARGPGGPHELALNAAVAGGDLEHLVDGDAARLLTTGALLLATVVTGSTALGCLLVNLVDRMDEPAADLARPLGEAARAGLIAGRGLAAFTRLSADEAPVRQATARVRERLTTLTYRSSRLPRASHVLDRLRGTSADLDLSSVTKQPAPPGTLRDALAAAALDQRRYVKEVADLLGKLSKPNALGELIDEDDRAYRMTGSKPIDGQVRNEMVATLSEDVAVVSRWVAACSRHGTPARTDFVHEQLTDVSKTLLTANQPLLDLLSNRLSDHDPLVAASARVAHTHMLRLVSLLSGRAQLDSAEPDIDTTLSVPLLALPAASWDAHTGLKLDLHGEHLTHVLLEVPDTGLDVLEAARAHAALDDYGSTSFLLRLLDEPQRSSERTTLATARAARMDELRARLHDLQRRLSRARVADPDADTAGVGSLVTLDAAAEERLSQRLERALRSLDDDDTDLRPVAETANNVLAEIHALGEANTRRLIERLDNLVATHARLAGEEIERVRRRIKDGLLDLADDDIAHLRSGEPLFDPIQDENIGAFFPAGVRAMGDGIDRELLAAVRYGREHAVLPSSPLSETVRDEVCAGLAGWRVLRNAFDTGWDRKKHVPDNLLPALRLIGLDVRNAKVDHLDGKPFAYARGRRFLDITGANITGTALVPAFGSAAQGRYRLLLVWNSPTAEQLDQWRESDSSHLPLIVCYFGVLHDRLGLVRRWSDPTRRSAVVLDDAVLTWVGTRSRTFDMFMRVTLPFTATQPFVREKRHDVPSEMFYGRERERRQLENPDGPSVVYGGRGLGKSALQRTIATGADSSPDDDFVVVWFEVKEVSGIAKNPDLLWGELAKRLQDKGVTPGPRVRCGNPRDWVVKAVKHWTSRPGRRLLILLDEAEDFFDGDAPQFAHVRRLYDISRDSNRACKVVFSGLHSVQHYYQAGNIPFSPAGHLQIGPLAPQPAYRLLTRPLDALGYRLGEDDAQRILLYCNYQPYLIQLVAHKLLDQQLDGRATGKASLPAPPWTIPSAEVRSALDDPQTRQDVRAAFRATLELDRRSHVIACVLALYAYDNPPEARMADVDLYNECRTCWPGGFKETTLVAFRELLNELAGLGILADNVDANTGRAIRNETVLRVLGTREDVARELSEVERTALTVPEARGHMRPAREGALRHGPLTTAQLGQLFRKGNNVHLVVGSIATGIEEVLPTLTEVTPEMVSVQPVSSTGEFKNALETGATDANRLLVVSNLCELPNIGTCQKALALALGDSSGAGRPKNRAASRTVVLLAGMGNIDWLVEVAGRRDAAEIVMPLERYTQHTLPLRWRGDPALETLANGRLSIDVSDATDGWPMLVEQLATDVRRARADRAEDAAAVALEKLLLLRSDEKWCRKFLTSSGAIVPSWPDMARLIEVFVQYGGPCSLRDVSVLAADRVRHLERTMRLAQWFGLITSTSTEDMLLSNLVGSCWQTAKIVAE